MSFLKKIINNIPNILTLFNLLLGTFSIVATLEGYPVWAGIFIITAAFFDFFDGLAARILKATSNLGKELDSLADIISFGLAPAFIVFAFLKSVLLINNFEADDINLKNLVILASPFLITVFSAIRLAKFNIDTRQETEFIGLPTPANAIFFAWFPIMLSQYELSVFFMILNLKTLLTLIFIHSLLLISPLPLFSFKIKTFDFKTNIWLYIFLILTLISIFLLKLYSVPFIIWLYVFIGIIRLLFNKFKKFSF